MGDKKVENNAKKSAKNLKKSENFEKITKFRRKNQELDEIKARKEVSHKASKKERLTKKQVFLMIMCGTVIGVVNGFFGGGGGMICVPLLENVLHYESKFAHATALVIIFPISFVSAVIYMMSGNLETISFLTVGSGVLLGGIVGSYLLKFLPEKVIRFVFVFIMLFAGIRLLF